MCSLTKLKSCRQEHKHVSKTRKTSVHRKMLKIKPTILKTTPPSDVSDSSSFLKPNSHLFNTRVWASSWSALPSYPPSPPPSFPPALLPSALSSFLPSLLPSIDKQAFTKGLRSPGTVPGAEALEVSQGHGLQGCPLPFFRSSVRPYRKLPSLQKAGESPLGAQPPPHLLGCTHPSHSQCAPTSRSGWPCEPGSREHAGAVWPGHSCPWAGSGAA